MMSAIHIDELVEGAKLSEDLYRQYHPLVLTICRRYLECEADAEDAAAEIFLRLPRALKSYDPAQPLARWLAAVASHYCIDMLRRRRSESRVIQPQQPADFEPVAHGPSPLQEVESRERARRVRAAIGNLREHYRAPLVLFYFEEMTDSEIATRLGQSRANIRIRLWRAKKQLHAALRPALKGLKKAG